jgi:sugar phosphate isomerase/epimerase
MKFGVNSWVWTSPLTTEELEKLAPKVAEMGFDILEVPLEGLGDLDYERGAEILNEYGLAVTCCAAMGPDRDLIHPDEAIRLGGMTYLKGAIDACQVLGASNLVGPLYSAVAGPGSRPLRSASATSTCWWMRSPSWLHMPASGVSGSAWSRLTASRRASSTWLHRPAR